MKWRNYFPPIALIVMSYNLAFSLILKTILVGVPFVGLFFFVLTVALAHKLSFWQLYFANILPSLIEYLTNLPQNIRSTVVLLPVILPWLKDHIEQAGAISVLHYLNLPTMLTLIILQSFITLLLGSFFITIFMKIINHFLPKRLKLERIGY